MKASTTTMTVVMTPMVSVCSAEVTKVGVLKYST
jgi:hypothetical protein